jgi:hypothetical protein
MSPFGWIILAFVFMRLRRRRHYWRMQRFAWQGPIVFAGPFGFHGMQRPLEPAPALPQQSAFEALKTRYVQGEIGDEQYEHELDELLKTPAGRGQIQ